MTLVLRILAAGLGMLAANFAATDAADVPPGYGPKPTLVQPRPSFIPTVNIARAVGWPDGSKPHVPSDLAVTAYAKGLKHPRWLYVLPNGDILVAETDAPPKPDDNGGIKGWFVRYFLKRAGSNSESADRITLLRGLGADGRASERHTFLSGLRSPFGMTLVGNALYVANTDALLRFPYHEGSKLFVTVGSNSNIAENGMAAEKDRAEILEIDRKTGVSRVFASGLRNPNGMAFEPTTKVLWTVVNERDGFGDDLVPDYLTSVKDGAFYGWPYSYFGQHVDDRVRPQDTERVTNAIAPDYGLGAHTASLGLAFSLGASLPKRFASGAFIGQHGSWNRNPPSGYKVIFVPFADGNPSSMPEDVLTGFLNSEGDAQGRPVGVAMSRDGALLVADDVGNAVWRITGANARANIENPMPD